MTPARALDFAADALAVARLARLVTTDTFPPAARARQRAYLATQRRHGQEWVDGWGCDWCAGAWLTAAVVLARAVAPRAWEPVGRALAVAQVAGMVGR